ncbi:MAG: hypothetical protein IPO08_23570 [Xanthomonadales bacterium]|nr:hypothetical protein [Xanthomonadales bacterium]
MRPEFPPIGLLSNREPWEDQQRIPGSPHNLPPVGARPVPAAYMGGVPDSGRTPIFDAHHYAQVNDNSTALPELESSMILQQPISRRNYLMLRNASTISNIYISFASDASANSTMKLSPGTIILFDVVVPQDDMYAFADSNDGQLSFAYSNIAT